MHFSAFEKPKSAKSAKVNGHLADVVFQSTRRWLHQQVCTLIFSYSAIWLSAAKTGTNGWPWEKDGTTEYRRDGCLKTTETDFVARRPDLTAVGVIDAGRASGDPRSYLPKTTQLFASNFLPLFWLETACTSRK
jgi:hypothetical protein